MKLRKISTILWRIGHITVCEQGYEIDTTGYVMSQENRIGRGEWGNIYTENDCAKLCNKYQPDCRSYEHFIDEKICRLNKVSEPDSICYNPGMIFCKKK